MQYRLIEEQIVPCPDIIEWARLYKKEDRRIAWTEIGESKVSTVFLGIDHNFNFHGPSMERIPILFETMVFGGPLSEEMERYATIEEARIGHAAICDRVRSESAE